MSNTKNNRKRLSSDSLPTLDSNSCNNSKKSKLESMAINALVAYGSDSSEDENEIQDDKKSTILQRLQHKAEMFKQKEMDKLTKVESSDSCVNSQPDILDIIGEEVPPDYVVEKSNVLKSSDKLTDDIFDVLKSEVPPDYVDDTINNNTDKDILDSKTQPIIIENDNMKLTDEKTKSTTLDSSKDNSLKSFNLIANYGEEEDLDDLSKNSFILFN